MYIRPDVSFVTTESAVTDLERSDDPTRIRIYWDFGTRFATLDVAVEVLELLRRCAGGQAPIPNDARSESITAFIEFLRARQLTIDKIHPDEGRWSRQMPVWLVLTPQAHPDETQARLARSRVAILGLGGVGSNVLVQLALAGVESFLLLDPDVVSESNRNRQTPFLAPDLLGTPKVHAAAGWLRANARLGESNVELVSALLDAASLNTVRKWAPDVVIVAADEPDLFTNLLAVIESMPEVATLAAGGYFGLTAFAGPLLVPSARPCQDCLTAFFHPPGLRPTHRSVGGSIVTTATMAASISVTASVLYLAGVNYSRNALIDSVIEVSGMDGTMRRRPIRRSGCCSASMAGPP